MPKHLLTSGETIDYPEPAPAVAAFLARAHAAAADPAVGVAGMVELIYGPENPILDRAVNPNRPMVTAAVFADPVYRILSDLIGVKQLQLGHVTSKAIDAAYTIPAAEAADQLGLTGAAVRAALKDGRLAGRIINGQWYTRPEAVAGFRVSTRGRRKARSVADSIEKWKGDQTAGRPPAGEPVVTVEAGAATGANLSVRCKGLKLERGQHGRQVGELPTGWTVAVVRIVGEKGQPRTLVIEPAPGADERIHVGPFQVRGPFKIARRHNSPRSATEVWEAAPIA